MSFIQLQFRRGNASQWTIANPILADGELAIESDTSKFKIGNGIAVWDQLPYGGLVGPTGAIGSNVPNDISFNGNIFVGRDVSFGGKLTVRNDVSFNTELRVGGNANIRSSVGVGGNLNVALDTSLTSRLLVGGNVLLSSNLTVGADAYFNGNTSVAFLPFYGGNPSVTPALNQLVTKKYVDENGGTILLGANNTWTANNTFNGSRFYVGGDASFNSNLTVREDVSFNKRLFVGGDASFNGNLIVRGDVSFNDNMSVQSDSSFNNRLYVGKQIGVGVTANAAYALDVFGNIHMSGNLFLNNKLFSITSADISLNANLMVGADASFNGNVFVAKTLNLRKTVITGAASGSPTSIVATTPIVEITGSSASAAYFTLTNGSYAGQTLTINSAANGGGGGLFVNATTTNIIFNGSSCSQMRFSNAFQTVNLVWSSDVNQWIVASWQGVNFSGVSMNFGTYTSGDISFGAAGRVNITAGGNLVVGSDSSFNGNLSVGVGKWIGIGKMAGTNYALDVGGNINLTGNIFTNGVLFSAFDNSKDISLNANLTVGFDSSFNANLYVGRRFTVAGGDVSLNQRLTVGGADSSFNGNLYVGGFLNVNGYVNADSYTEKFVNVASSSGTYTADFAGGLILYVNAFSGTSTPTLSITNLPTTLNQSYVFTVVYSGAPTSTYFSSLNINGTSVPVNGTVSLSAATSYYIHQFCIFFTDATNISNNCVVQNFNSSAPASLVSPLISGNLAVSGNINLTGGNIYQNGVLFVGGGGGGTVGPSLSLGGNLYVGGDVSFNGKLYGNGDVSFNQRIFVGSDLSVNANVNIGGNINFRGNLYQNGVLFVGGGGGSSTTGTTLSLSDTTQSFSPITGAFKVAGGAGVGGNVEVGGNIDIASTLASTSSTTGSLIVRGGAGIVGNVNVGSAIQSVSAITGAFTVVGGAGVGGNVNVGGNVKINSAIASTSSSTGALTVGGGVGIDGVLNTNNNINTSGVINTTNGGAAVSSSTGAIIVNGGIGVGGNVQVAGIIRTTLTTASTSTSTGALIVGGGAGIAGNIYAGDSLYVTGSIVSPSLTGTPTAPTATGGGAGSTQIATTAYVRGEISALVGGAGTALDTLNELATALGTDAAFSTTVTTAIGLRANIANPTFTGIVSTPALSVTGTTASTSSITGALVVGGGAGIAGNLWIGATTVSSNSITGALVVGGGVGIGRNLIVNGTTYSNTTSTSALIVGGDSVVGGNLFVGQTMLIYNFENNLLNTGTMSSFNGIDNGPVSYSTDSKVGTKSLSLDGISQFVTIPDFQFSSAGFSIAFWVKINDLTNPPERTFLNFVNNTTVNSNTRFFITSGNNMFAQVAGSGSSIDGLFGNNQWAHIAFTFSYTTTNQGNSKSYLNGVPQKSFTGSIKYPDVNHNHTICIGKNGPLGIQYTTMLIDNLIINNGVWTDADVTNVYSNLSLSKNFINVSNSGVLSVYNTTVSSNSTTGALIVGGGAGIGGNVEVGGNVEIASTLASTSSITGALVVSGGAGVVGNLWVGSAIQSTSSITGALVVGGGVGIGGNVSVGGNVNFVGDLYKNGTLVAIGGGSATTGTTLSLSDTTASTSSTTGALVVSGGIGCGENLYTTGIVRVGSSTNSSGAGTGALIVAGGASIGGTSYIAGAVNITNSTASSGTTSGALVVGGGVGIGGAVNIGNSLNVRYANPSLQLTGTGEYDEAKLFLSTPHASAGQNSKTAIIAKGALGFSRSDLLFCIQSGENNATTVSSSDAKMIIKAENGFVGIGTTTPSTALQVNGAVTADNITFRSNTKISQAITVSLSIDGSNFCKNGSFTLTSTGVWNVSILWQARWQATGASTPAAMFITTNSTATYTRVAAEALTDFKETATSTAVYTDNYFYHRLNTTLTITASNLTWNIYIGKFNNSSVSEGSLYLTATRIG